MADDDLTLRSGERQVQQPANLVSRKPDPMLGTVFAERYTILSVLGRGGMGVVYKARHDLMDRVVAIKTMLPQLVSDDVSLQRFQREARAASKINHPNVIAIHDFGMTSDTGVAYLVMDFVDGQTLSDAIKSQGQLTVERSGLIFLQVCDALEHAHKTGIVHRDLKPGNIMLVTQQGQEDFVKILDFGVAKLASSDNETDQQRLTTTGEIFGSPIYMSPEQCSGNQLDARSDIYSLGCVMYETIMGKPPCLGKNALETISRHISIAPPPFKQARPDLSVPEWTEKIVFKALEKDPANRQQSMQVMFDELYNGLGAAKSAKQMKQIVSSLRSADMAKPAPKDPMKISKSQRTTTNETPNDAATPVQSGNNQGAWPIIVTLLVLAGLALGGTFAWLNFQGKNPFAHAQQFNPLPKPNIPNSFTDPIAPPGTPNLLTPANPLLGNPPTPSSPITPSTAPAMPNNIYNPSEPYLGMPEEKHPVAAVKPHKRPSFPDLGALDKPIKIKKPASADTGAAEPVRHRKGQDFYDYSIQHDGEGNAVSLPTKPYGNE